MWPWQIPAEILREIQRQRSQLVAIEVTVTSVERVVNNVLRRVESMASEIERLRAAIEANNEAGDAMIAKVLECLQKIKDIVDSSKELGELKTSVLEEAVKAEEQVGQFQAILNPPPPPPAE